MNRLDLRLLSSADSEEKLEPAFLTPISTSYKISDTRRRAPEPKFEVEVDSQVTKQKIQTKSETSSPEDALEIIQHEPDYDSLVAVLRFLARGLSAGSGSGSGSGSFNIAKPAPQSAQIVQVLVTEIAPNYWTLLKEDDAPRGRVNGGKTNNISDLDLFLSCLRSITGINAILLRLRALIQEAKVDSKDARRSDTALHLDQTLELLSAVLEGDDRVQQIWTVTARSLDTQAKRRTLSQELLAVFGNGKVVSLSAEAEQLARQRKDIKEDASIWVASALEYTNWLARNIATWASKEPPVDDVKLCSDLILKGSRLGHSDTLVKLLVSRLLLNKKPKSRCFQQLLQNLPQSEQRKVLFSVLNYLSETFLDRLGPGDSESCAKTIAAVAGVIGSIVDTAGNSTSLGHLVTWLTSSAGAGLGEAVGIRRAVVAVVSQDKDSTVDVLWKSLSQFGDKLYINHSPTLQQEAHAQVLILTAGYVHRKSPIKLTMLMKSSEWLNAVSNRLAAFHDRARWLGMVVGEALSNLVDKGDKRLDFHMDETNSEEGLWYKGLSQITDKIGAFDMLLEPQSDAPASEQAPRREYKNKKEKPSRPPPVARPPQQQGFIIEEIEDEDESEEDDIVPYAKPDSDDEDSDEDPTLVRRNKPKAPVYIRDLIRYLRDTENYDHQKLALATAPTLIRRKANYGTEVAEHVEELASLLVGLQDKFDIENFNDLRVQGMIAVVMARPEAMGQWFAKTLFHGDYSVNQRASILIVLGLSAREIAGFETSEYAEAAAFPSKRLPERVERLYLGTGPSSGQYLTSASSLKPLPLNALDKVAEDITTKFLGPIVADAADSATGPDVLKLSTFASRLQDDSSPSSPGHPSNIRRKTHAKPRVRNIPNTTAQLIARAFFAPLIALFQAALHAPGGPRTRTTTVLTQPDLLALFLKTLGLLLHAAGPSTLALPHMTAELWRLVLGPGVRARAAAAGLGVTGAVLFALLVLLQVNEERMRDVCAEMGREVVEAQEWVAGVFADIRGGQGSGEEDQVKMLAAGVLVRLQEGMEKYRLLLAGDLIG